MSEKIADAPKGCAISQRRGGLSECEGIKMGYMKIKEEWYRDTHQLYDQKRAPQTLRYFLKGNNVPCVSLCPCRGTPRALARLLRG